MLPGKTECCRYVTGRRQEVDDLQSVASLGLASPGAATDGVTYFSSKKLTTFL